ncbi:hypothetical protein GCM10023211_00670 [Orbus sasakiae]|uniref:MFS transporter n=1 Tax=Orbus sasakiae TaxID=1078475 RepID=A0ABP9MZX0_9GAMM
MEYNFIKKTKLNNKRVVIMDTIISNKSEWTWADLISSYRFWGLIIFIFFLNLINVTFSYIAPFLVSEYGYPYYHIGYLVSFRSVGLFLAIIPAWVASRTKSYYALYVFSAIAILSLLGISLFSDNLFIMSICLFCIALSTGASTLFIAANIAKATNSIEFFVLAFGLLSTVTWMSNFIAPVEMALLVDSLGYKIVFIINIFIVIAGVLFLLPIKKTLFTENPSLRHVESFGKTYHEPVVTFLLATIIPFYLIFWFVRAYRDIRYYSQSAKLMTPFGAGWSALLVPFAMPVMLIVLNDVINEKKGAIRKTNWGLILISLFLLPIGVAVVQNKLNELSLVE